MSAGRLICMGSHTQIVILQHHNFQQNYKLNKLKNNLLTSFLIALQTLAILVFGIFDMQASSKQKDFTMAKSMLFLAN